MANASVDSAVTEFGAGCSWAIFQAYALSVPLALETFGYGVPSYLTDVVTAVSLVVAIAAFQLALYSEGAPNAAVHLGLYVGGKETSILTSTRKIVSTILGSVVGSVFARDTLTWVGVSAEGMKPPVTHYPELGDNLVLGIETATSLVICALAVLVLPSRPILGLAGLFLVPVPAAIVGVPGIDPAWSLGRAFAAKDFENNALYLVGPFAGALAFGVACHAGAKLGALRGGAKPKRKRRKSAAASKKKTT